MYKARFLVVVIGLAVMAAPSIVTAGGFWEGTTVDAWIASSYNINFENHKGGPSPGSPRETANPFQPFHMASHEFQLDQVFLVIDKPTSDDSRVGGHVAFAYGEGHGGMNGYLQLDVLQSAYFSYRAPVMEGLVISGGLLPTRIGAEDTTATGNFNITRGLVWGIQPINNTGLIVDMYITPDLAVVLGVVNDPLDGMTGDNDKEKAVIGGLAWTGGMGTSGSLIVQWGDSTGSAVLPSAIVFPTNKIETFFVDLVLRSDPSEGNITGWLDVTFRWDEFSIAGSDFDVYYLGIAAAARYAISDHCGVSVRAESLSVFVDGDSGTVADLATLSVTTDYTVMEHLTFKAEVRMDIATADIAGSSNVGILPNARGILDDKVAGTFLAQAILTF
jgi:hypothetical protein